MNLNACWDPVRVLGVVLGSSVSKLDLLHKLASQGILHGVNAVVVGSQHPLLPSFFAIGDTCLDVGLTRAARLASGLGQQTRDDVHHRVVGRLSGGRVPLCRVSNDAKRRLVRLDDDPLDSLWPFGQGRVGGEQVDDALDGAR